MKRITLAVLTTALLAAGNAFAAPETYVIDKAGVIRYKQIGPITEEALRDKILPLVKGLQ